MQLWELCLAGKNLYCKLGFVKLQIRVLNYKVTGCARLIGIHLGDHRVDASESVTLQILTCNINSCQQGTVPIAASSV